MQYFAVVHQEDDSAFGVHFPDVPGCFSAADEMEDLTANAAEALALHLEDEIDLPRPRSISEIRLDSEVRMDLENGAFLISVPLIRLTGRSAKANITMDAGLLSAIDAAARRRKLTRSAYLADVARRDIENRS